MTKEAVLSILKNNSDYVSGEKISSELGVSRMAISQAVKSLRQDGYTILSTTNKGYLLVDSDEIDKLSTGELMSYLPKERMNNILCVDSIDSTNTKLRQLAYENAPEGYVVIANEQTKGRGRLGRDFHSPKDKGIYISMLLRPDCLPAESQTITAWTSVAISNAIKKVSGVAPDIKWVNDLLINNKKICGILTELAVESETGRILHIIVGIGINVSHQPEDFPEELRDIASSICHETKSHIKRAKLAAAIIEEMDKLSKAWPNQAKEYISTYRSRNITTGKDIFVISGNSKKEAKALEINEDFSLKVMYNDGTIENVSSGEVSTKFNS